MKSITAILFVAVALAVFSSTQAAKKRAIAREHCPQDSTLEECDAYAKSKSEKYQYCNSYNIYKDTISWMSCGTIRCDGDLVVVEEDLSKPYPECCRTCKLRE